MNGVNWKTVRIQHCFFLSFRWPLDSFRHRQRHILLFLTYKPLPGVTSRVVQWLASNSLFCPDDSWLVDCHLPYQSSPKKWMKHTAGLISRKMQQKYSKELLSSPNLGEEMEEETNRQITCNLPSLLHDHELLLPYQACRFRRFDVDGLVRKNRSWLVHFTSHL